MDTTTLQVRRLGTVDYGDTLVRMRRFTEARTPDTADEIWLLEHPPVYTLGVRARHRAPAVANSIPTVITDRGGDVTYHGPGQPIVYVMIDLVRRQLGIQRLVYLLEQAVIDTTAELGIEAERRSGAPGVYVSGSKIASLGLRVRAGRSYHGLALNAAMDLTPFHAIDPCGYPGLSVTQLAHWHPHIDKNEAGELLLRQVLRLLSYTEGLSSPEDRGTS